MHVGDTSDIGVYLIAKSETNANGDGSKSSPFTSLSDAIALAASEGRDLYVANGTYDTQGLSITQSVRIYGGFNGDFSERSLDTFATLFYSDSSEQLLSISGASSGVLQGISFEQRNTTFTELGHLAFSNADSWQIEDNLFSVNAATLAAETFTSLSITSSQNVVLSGNTLEASSASDEHVGLVLDDSSALIRNTLIATGESEGTTGIALTNSAEATLIHSTIDGGIHASGSAIGILADNAASLTVSNTIIVIDEAIETHGILCTGNAAPALSIANSLFYFDATSPALSLYTDCTGTVHTSIGDLETNLAIATQDVDFAMGDRADLIDVDHHLVTGSMAIDAGSALSADMLEGDAEIAIDMDLEDRDDGAPDIGADEI